MKVWCLSPQTGGTKIPLSLHKTIADRINVYSEKNTWSDCFQIKLRYKGQFCYLDASENDKEAFSIGRLRHFNI